MIDFMVIGLPRSGTTWMANWLTCEESFCLHDPLNKLHYEDWDTDVKYFPQDSLPLFRGISCTGIWRWPEWVNAHPAEKLIIIRDPDEVRWSLAVKGLDMNLPDEDPLRDIEGLRVSYKALFDIDMARLIWNRLIGTDFDEKRFNMLKEMHIEPEFAKVEKDMDVVNRLHRE